MSSEQKTHNRQKSRGLHGVLPEGRLLSSDFFRFYFFSHVFEQCKSRSAHPGARLRGHINKSLAHALCCAASG